MTKTFLRTGAREDLKNDKLTSDRLMVIATRALNQNYLINQIGSAPLCVPSVLIITPFTIHSTNLDSLGESYIALLRHKYYEIGRNLNFTIDLRFAMDGRILLDYDENYDFFRHTDFIDYRSNLYVKRAMYAGQHVYDFDSPS